MKYIIAVLLLFCSVTHAHQYPVETAVSSTNESKIQFLRDVGESLRAYAELTGFESCGEVATDGSRWSVIVMTSKSHISCEIDDDNVLPGFHKTGQTIHSHGRDAQFRPNSVDRDFLGRKDEDIRSHMVFMVANVNHFSPKDFSSGPGYLATPHGLLYQHGIGTEGVATK